uniref:Uncharacterized protein n=1 Tax=uncultured Thiotrichaceae bacterium TaxID=298394 RepID=A0A6S6UBW4_9GAMM|nr:MAG: Unknown protein [uncultured Thiotrichaceae bacterium]
MHILRWLFSHPVIFAWALAILAILLNYGVGGSSKEDAYHAEGGEATEQHAAADTDQAQGEGETAAPAVQALAGEAAEQVVEEVKAVVTEAETAVAATEQVTAEAVETVAATAEQVTQAATDNVEKVAAGAAAVVATATAVVAASDAAAETEVAQEAETTEAAPAAQEAEVTEAIPAVQEAEVTEAAPAAQEAEVTEATPAAQEAEVTEAAAQEGATGSQDLLLAAREAYWSEDFDRASEFYQELLAQDDQPAYKGELANVFWKQGKSAEAVQLYSDIAVWLKDQGRMAELQNIKVYVDLVDPVIGEKIGALLK